MKSSREFNRKYRKYGITIKYQGIKHHYGAFVRHWIITYKVSDEKEHIGDTYIEIVYSMIEAEDVAEKIIKCGYVKECTK